MDDGRNHRIEISYEFTWFSIRMEDTYAKNEEDLRSPHYFEYVSLVIAGR
jgi:hypothetical protein